MSRTILIAVILMSVNLTGCISHHLVENITSSAVNEVQAGVVPDLKKIVEIAQTFRDMHHRWPHDASELRSFAQEKSLDLNLRVIDTFTFQPHENDQIDLTFDYRSETAQILNESSRPVLLSGKVTLRPK